MDKRNKLYKVKALINSLEDREYHLDELKREIMMTIGSYSKTIIDTLKIMGDFHMIREVRPFFYMIKKE